MCGIAGFFRRSATTVGDDAVLAAAVTALAHRGPDGQGLLRLAHAGLGHARLAIIDLESGAQPMRSVGRRCAIVFNGEIYNYRELRAELAATGFALATHSDTEVVIGLYETGGIAALGRLRGMYAFALWDEREQCGLLVRDPVGIKPLFYADDGDGNLCFGSEAKAILAQRSERPRLAVDALHLLLNFRYVAGDQSLFEGIGQVPPGTAMIWSPHSPLQSRSLPEPRQVDGGPLAEAIIDSVRAHLTADVEVGAYLSGGIDSALVVAAATRAQGHGLPTFTLDVGDDPLEASNARASARLLGVDNTTGTLPDPTPGRQLRLLWHLEAPKVNAWQSSVLAGLARRRVKVALSGLGGDELFYGYNAHRWLHWVQRINAAMPGIATRTAGRLAERTLGSLSGVPNSEPERAAQVLAGAGNWSRVYGLLRNVWDRPGMRRWLYGPRMLDARLPDAFEWLDAAWPDDPDPLRAMVAFEWRHKMVNDLLWHEDRASMAEGLEVRVPFADAWLHARVRQEQAAVPAAAELGKSRLRAAARELLPAQIMTRPKSGFQLDAPAFLAGAMAGEVEFWLNDERVRRHQIFNPETVRQLRRLPPSKRYRWHSFMLWLMIQTHQWIAVFEDGMTVPTRHPTD